VGRVILEASVIDSVVDAGMSVPLAIPSEHPHEPLLRRP
jgi:hypothetical protein